MKRQVFNATQAPVGWPVRWSPVAGALAVSTIVVLLGVLRPSAASAAEIKDCRPGESLAALTRR